MEKIISGYKKAKINMIKNISNNREGINDEIPFLDDAIIASKIRYIQRLCLTIDEEINNDNVDNEKKVFLNMKKSELIDEIALLASNSLDNINFSISIISNNNPFCKCLEALKEFNERNFSKSFDLFKSYFVDNMYIPEHYLVCSIYGKILFEQGDYMNALMFLRKAVEKRPQELETHLLLYNIYNHLNDSIMKQVESEIIQVLGGDLYEYNNMELQ